MTVCSSAPLQITPHMHETDKIPAQAARSTFSSLPETISKLSIKTAQIANLIAPDLLPEVHIPLLSQPKQISQNPNSLASKKITVLHSSFLEQPTIFSLSCETMHKVLSFAQNSLLNCLNGMKNEKKEVQGLIPSILSILLTPLLQMVSTLLESTSTDFVQWNELIAEFEKNGTFTKSQKSVLESTNKTDQSISNRQLTSLLDQLNYKTVQTTKSGATHETLKEILVTRFLQVFQEKPELQSLFSPSEKALFLRLSHAEEVMLDKTILFSLLRKASLYEWACHNVAMFDIECSQTSKKGFSEAIKSGDMRSLSDALFATIGTEKIAHASPPYQTYLQELKKNIETSHLDSITDFISQEKELSLLLNTTRELKSSLKQLYSTVDFDPLASVQIEKLEALFTTIQTESFDKLVDIHFGSLSQWSHRAALLGTLKRTFMRASSYFHDFKEQKEHQKTTRVSSLWCNHGGGHKSLTDATRPYLESPVEPIADRRFAVIDLDLPKVVRSHLDPIYKIASTFGCTEVDAPKLFNWLLVNDHCSIYMFLKSIGLKKPSEEAVRAATDVVRKALLQTGSDLIQMNYTFDNSYIDPASKSLGIPLAHITSDIDNSGWDFSPTNPHFRLMTQSKEHPRIRATIGPNIKEKDLVDMGLPVGKEFDQLPTPEELAAFKRDVLSIHDDRSIVVFTNGANGTISPLPELLATQYKDTTKPIALVVVCGRNEELKKHMETHVQALAQKNSAVTLIPLGFQKKDAMAKLYRLSSCVFGKPGGLTTMECLKSGTRFIADNTKPRFTWEKFNSEIVEESGRGCHIEKNEQLVETIREQIELAKRPPVPQPFIDINAGLAMERGLLDLVREAEQNPEFQERKKSFLRFSKRFAEIQV